MERRMQTPYDDGSPTRKRGWTFDVLGDWDSLSATGTGVSRTHNMQEQSERWRNRRMNVRSERDAVGEVFGSGSLWTGVAGQQIPVPLRKE
jgi:hypothetical protein